MNIRIRPLAPLAALALLAACGGKSTTAQPAAPGLLELACSVSLSGPAPVLNVLVRANTKAAATAPAITVTLKVQPTPQTLTLTGPGWAASKELRNAGVPPGGWMTAEATVDGQPASVNCQGYPGLPPVAARVARTATGADLSWSAVTGAVTYRWSLRDGPIGPVVFSGTTTGTSATISADPATLGSYVAEVGAYALTGAETSFPATLPSPKASFGRALFTAGSGGGDGVSAWQLFGPNDYVNGALTVGFPALGSGERLAVLLSNSEGDDGNLATVSVVGTGSARVATASTPLAAMAAAPLAPLARADEPFDRADVMAGEALVSAHREETMARLRDGRLQRHPALAGRTSLSIKSAAAALPASRFFCQGRINSAGSWTYVWSAATLAYETPNAAFYYANDVATGIGQALDTRPDFWSTLGAAYERAGTGIHDTLNTYFGPETDVDGNGKMVFLFGNLGKTTAGGFVVGYFSPADIEAPLATAGSCSRGQSGNQTDMLFLLDPGTFTANWAGRGTYAQVLDLILGGDYQGVMSHELQHNVNFNTHCPPGQACGVEEETWLNEGLSMLSETVAGYGLHGSVNRRSVRNYQGIATSTGLPYYQDYSMTAWAGDAIGNYAGVQAYMQYLLDHASPAMTRALHNRWLSGKANVEAATGVPWEVGFARFTTAAMFSNEDTTEPNGALGALGSTGHQLADPLLNYLGDAVAPDYVPWHRYTDYCSVGGQQVEKARTAYVAFTPVSTSAGATLRHDGWAAFATGPGTGGAATLRVQSSGTVRPHVVVVKYSGALSNYVVPTCP